MVLNNIPDINEARYAFWGDSAAELATLQAAQTAGVTAATLLGSAPYESSVTYLQQREIGGFRRGVNFGTNVQQAGMSTAFAGAASDAQLVAAKAAGVTDVEFVVFQYQATQTANAIAADATYTATDAAVTHAVQYAQALGLRAAIKPHVRCSDGSARATIHPTDTAAWFASYTAFITHYATLAQTLGCDLFVVGTEFASLQTTVECAIDTTSASVNFTITAPVGALPVITSANVGMPILLLGAGASGAALITTIATVTGNQTGTLGVAASATLTKTGSFYGYGLDGTTGTIATSAGTRPIVGSATTWDQSNDGDVLIIKGGGVSAADLTTTIQSVSDATHAKTRDNVTNTAASAVASWYRTDKRWRAVIAAVRAVFTGIVVFAADTPETVTFWDALDAIGVDFYELPALANSASADAMYNGWRENTLSANAGPGGVASTVATSAVDRLAKVQRRYGKPVIITECGARSSAAAGFSNVTATLEAAGASAATQAAYFAAVQRLVQDLPWIKGLYWWWWTTDGPDPGAVTDYPFQTLASLTTISAWNALPWPVNPPGSKRPTDWPVECNLRLSTAQSIPNAGALTGPSWAIPTTDSDDLTNRSASRVKINTPGMYDITAKVAYASDATGTYRHLEILRQVGGFPFGQSGGVQVIIDSQDATPLTGRKTYVRCHRRMRLNEGDIIYAQTSHDATGALNITTTIAGNNVDSDSYMSLVRIGP